MRDDPQGKPSDDELEELLTGELSTREFERGLNAAQDNPTTSDDRDDMTDLVDAIDQEHEGKKPTRVEREGEADDAQEFDAPDRQCQTTQRRDESQQNPLDEQLPRDTPA